MLIALLAGQRIEAARAEREALFECPECRRSVILKRGEIRIAHFAHRADEGCHWSEGETIGHLTAKRLICDSLRAQGLKAEVEYVVNDRRLDVAVWLPSGRLAAVEIQHSTMSVETLTTRMKDYESYGIAQIWLPFIRDYAHLYSPRPYESYLMSLARSRYGMWFWDENSEQLQLAKFFNAPYVNWRIIKRSRLYRLDEVKFVEGNTGCRFAINSEEEAKEIDKQWMMCSCDPPVPDPQRTACTFCRGHLPSRQNINQRYGTRICIIPGCGQPIPMGRIDAKLCDEHYAPVSDEAIARYIEQRLAAKD